MFYEIKIWNSEKCFEEEHGRTAQQITELKIPPPFSARYQDWQTSLEFRLNHLYFPNMLFLTKLFTKDIWSIDYVKIFNSKP